MSFSHPMPDFSRFVYRFFAVLALLSLGACFLGPEQDSEESQAPAAPVASAAAPTAGMTGLPTAPAVPVPTPTPIESYAPPSHLSKDTAISGEGYAPTSHIDAANKAVTVKIGLLIPMSGASKALGKSLLDAAVLAVYDKYSVMSPREITAKIELLPEDTGDTIEGAEKASQDAIEGGATLLLGPVFSKQVSAVASIARSKHIPIITFSNNTTVAGAGVYLFGFMPEQQVVRIVQYSLAHKMTNVAVLVPSNPYGAAIVKELSSEMRKRGGRAYPVEYYPEDLHDLNINIDRLSRFLQDDPGKNQALFIAEGSQKLKVITDALAANSITSSKIQFLGSGLWDDPEINRWPALTGGLFASSPPEKYHAFAQHFASTYGYAPERRASLSYDAVALAATIAISTSGTGFPASTFTDPVGFSGPANGIFRFHDDGTIERGLSVLMVTPQGFRTIEPAPALFDQ